MSIELLPRICYRINIIGDYRCGKTTIFQNNNDTNIGATVSPEMDCRYYKYNNENYSFIITDTPGHSSYNKINECYYDNYDCLLIVVDLSSEKSYLNLPFLIEKVESINKNYNSNYLRHPLNNCNQIDISFKFSQVKNEQITQIFH